MSLSKSQLDSIISWSRKIKNLKDARPWLEEKLLEIYKNTSGPSDSPHPAECFILHALSKNMKGDILEIGSWKGRSSCFLAQGIKESKVPNRRLHCVDWFKGDSTGGAFPDMEAMKDRISFFGLDNYVSIYNHDMLTFDYDSLLNIDLVFYDSDHNTEPTTKVLKKISGAISQNAIVCLHDASWPITKKAIENVGNIFKHLVTIDTPSGFAILKHMRPTLI